VFVHNTVYCYSFFLEYFHGGRDVVQLCNWGVAGLTYLISELSF
jgi:hypothetical protein